MRVGRPGGKVLALQIDRVAQDAAAVIRNSAGGVAYGLPRFLIRLSDALQGPPPLLTRSTPAPRTPGPSRSPPRGR
jgi:hypothetical protein